MRSDFIFDAGFDLLSIEDQRHFLFLVFIDQSGMLDKGYPEHMLTKMLSNRLGVSLDELPSVFERLASVGLVDTETRKPTGGAIYTPSRPPAHIWREIRSRIFARDNYTCNYCGAHGVALECDHVHPVALGGDSEDDNLVTACLPCNRSKRDKKLEEWVRK